MSVHEGQPNRNWHLQISSNYKWLSSTEISKLEVIEINTCLIIWAQERKKEKLCQNCRAKSGWLVGLVMYISGLTAAILAGLWLEVSARDAQNLCSCLLPWRLVWSFDFLFFLKHSRYKIGFVHKALNSFLFNREEIHFSEQRVLYSNT